ncbi:hypothetical protein [Carnobacterium sp. ISL-102]|uniref:hypothetical protein n=1 Tax=Carnobacterium sp. ISL-102 TaxID=2819142 RepID=UPI001BEC5416|nr:hypothetical protein [Carnobacterium sp. ISL-102]MBT2731932.1 hypothetical protein [Carnobacterium sp. ISL-102]
MKIYLMLTDTNTILSKTIKLYTKATYNHASIALEPALLKPYSFGRKYAHNPFSGGYVEEDLSRHYFLRAQCTIYSCEISEQHYENLVELLSFYNETQSLYRYNLLGLVTLALNVDFDRRDAFFCSQFVASVLSESGIYAFEKEPHFITPGDLSQLPIFAPIYSGSLQEYLFSISEEQTKPQLLLS